MAIDVENMCARRGLIGKRRFMPLSPSVIFAFQLRACRFAFRPPPPASAPPHAPLSRTNTRFFKWGAAAAGWGGWFDCVFARLGGVTTYTHTPTRAHANTL